jgi:cell division transport system ATP-binding protein
MLIAPAFNSRPIISFHHVWKTYPNGTDALRDVSLTVPDGDFVFLVGASGAGKSSLVRLLIREEMASRGRLFVAGQELSRLRRHHLPHFRRRVGLVFQDFKLLPSMTVQENVAFALHTLGESVRVIRDRVDDALETVGLIRKARSYPCELSGGEQQRVAIARALVHEPSLFVADEPTGNLDPATAWDIMEILSTINAAGVTIVMATHNREIVDATRHRVVALERGQIIRDVRHGTYDEVHQAAAVRL